jgi:retinol dehydrogenase 12
LLTVKDAASEFLSKESRLHVLFNDAGVMFTPREAPRIKQGYEIQLETNALGHFLFTKILTPVLLETAKEEKEKSGHTAGHVRVVWVSSSFAGYFAQLGGVDMQY